MIFRFVQAIVLGVGLVFACTGGAEETTSASGLTNSEFAHQAEAGVFEVTPATGVQVLSVNGSGPGNYKTSMVTIPLQVSAEYGFSPYFSVAATLGYDSSSTTRTCDFGYSCSGSPKARGLADPEIDLKARLPLGSGTLRFGVNVASALDKSKTDSSGDSNQSTGGTTVSPVVIYERVLGPGFIGGAVQYNLYQSDRSVQDDTDTPTSYKVSGGQKFTLAAFYEANVGKLTYGGALTFQNVTSTKNKVDGDSTGRASGYNNYGFKYYMPVHFTPTIALLPQATIAVYDFPSSVQVSSVTGVGLEIAARFAF